MKKLVLISSKLKFNFESSIWTVEVIRTRFSCPSLLDFLKNRFVFKKMWNMDEIWAVMLSLHFKFLEESRLYWHFYACFREITFLKWRDVINSNSWFMAILKGFSGLPLFKLPNIFFLKLKRILGTVNK